MLTAVREVQVPLLAALLLGGCAAKAWRVLRPRSVAAVMDPAGLFPLRLRRPMILAMFAAELGLGLGLIATALRFGPVDLRLAATVVRADTALFFLIGVAALNETRQRRPEAGCGCFGEFSETPVGWRTIARAGMLCAAAEATIGLPPLRLGYSEPCEVRRIPASRSLTALHSSSQWRRYAGQVSAADVWREGCWWFVVYPGTALGRQVDIVFAVYLQARKPPIRVAVLDADADTDTDTDTDTDEIIGRPELASLSSSREI